MNVRHLSFRYLFPVVILSYLIYKEYKICRLDIYFSVIQIRRNKFRQGNLIIKYTVYKLLLTKNYE